MDDAADNGVEGFDARTGDAVLAEVEDLFLSLDQAAGKAFEFGDPALGGHGDPAREPVVGALAIGIGPDLAEGVLEQVGQREIAVGRQQGVELAASVGTEVFGVAQQVVSLAFEEGPAFGIRLGLGAAAHFADDFAEVGDEMELVEDDVGLRQMGLDGGAVGSAGSPVRQPPLFPSASSAIDADGGDAGFLLRAELGEEAFEGVLSTPLGQPEQFAGARVEHEGDARPRGPSAFHQ